MRVPANNGAQGFPIRNVVIDDLLPDAVARQIAAAFPAPDAVVAKSSLRERKHVAAPMDRYDPLLEEIVYAFQDPHVLSLVAGITGLEAMEPDANLYAGGISAMVRGAYLRPHLDNSHDASRERYRVLNLLYYVTPDWDESDGGSLQLWDDGPRGVPRTIASRFNRLVLMATDPPLLAFRQRCRWRGRTPLRLELLFLETAARGAAVFPRHLVPRRARRRAVGPRHARRQRRTHHDPETDRRHTLPQSAPVRTECVGYGCSRVR